MDLLFQVTFFHILFIVVSFVQIYTLSYIIAIGFYEVVERKK